jgi:hypothetical protein
MDGTLMNNLQKSLLTSSIAWFGVSTAAVLNPYLQTLLYMAVPVPPSLLTPLMLLPLLDWVALLAWVIRGVGRKHG